MRVYTISPEVADGLTSDEGEEVCHTVSPLQVFFVCRERERVDDERGAVCPPLTSHIWESRADH